MSRIYLYQKHAAQAERQARREAKRYRIDIVDRHGYNQHIYTDWQIVLDWTVTRYRWAGARVIAVFDQEHKFPL